MNNVGYAVSQNGKAIMLAAQRTKKKYEAFIIDNSGKLTVNELALSTDQLVRKINIKEDLKGNFKCVGLLCKWNGF